jgi:hypothetical protein
MREAKINFKMFDFFANFGYIEEKLNYDEVLKLPIKGLIRRPQMKAVKAAVSKSLFTTALGRITSANYNMRPFAWKARKSTLCIFRNLNKQS